MAIAFDAASSGGTSSTSPVTWSHTVGAGSNTLLLVGVAVNSVTQSTATAVSFNGVAMTKMTSLQGSNVALSTNEVSIWALAAPAAGAHTVSVTTTLGTLPDLAGGSISYTGAAQTVTPDATGSTTNSSTTQGSQSFNVVTVTDNDWVVAIGNYVNNGATQTTLTAGQTSRATQPMSINLNGVFRMEDTNAVKTPPGTQAMTMTTGGGTGQTTALFTAVGVAIAPFVAAATAAGSTVLMMGV